MNLSCRKYCSRKAEKKCGLKLTLSIQYQQKVHKVTHSIFSTCEIYSSRCPLHATGLKLPLQPHWDLILWGKRSWVWAQDTTEVEYTGKVKRKSFRKLKYRTVEDKEERRHSSLKDSQWGMVRGRYHKALNAISVWRLWRAGISFDMRERGTAISARNQATKFVLQTQLA